MLAVDILKIILKVALKASQIATIIRKEKTLLELLVEEKTSKEKDGRFFQDFKTLADVLIQETVKHYIGKQIPSIYDSIFGEESNTFTNALGETVIVEIKDSCEETKELLKKALDNNEEAAKLLAQAVHSDVQISEPSCDGLEMDIDVEDCGIWIDPIDGTGQYIEGKLGKKDDYGMVTDGLQCVAVLIGMFEKATGKPIIGVVNQPFSEFKEEDGTWISNTFWGICCKDVRKTSIIPSLVSRSAGDRIVLSGSESKKVQQALTTKYNLVFASGAGNKLLATVLGFANAYVLSHRSIYRWDCCALHPILQALGGGIVSYKHALEQVQQSSTPLTETDMSDLQVNYKKSAGAIGNRKMSLTDEKESLPGIIAYRFTSDALCILNQLKSTL